MELVTAPTISKDTAAALRKRWTLLMPAVFFTYSLAYLDRANYGFGAAAGMAQTLGITPQRSSLLGALFFLGYFLFQIPGAAYASRRSATRVVFFALLLWGTMATLTGIVRSFALLAIIRFLLGVAESLIIPSMLVLLTRWFTRAERSRANTALILGNPVTVLWMSAITGFLIERFGWQRTFIIEGLPSILWAFVWIAFVRDRPANTPWMTGEARAHLANSLASEQAALPQVEGITGLLRQPIIFLLCIQYFAWSIGVYGFVLWLPSIVQRGAARGIGVTGLLSAVPYAFAIIAMVLTAHLSDRSANRARFIWPTLAIGGIALFVSYLTANYFAVAYAALLIACAGMYAPYGPFYATIPEMLPSNVAGEAMALVNSFGALGGFAGTYIIGVLQSSFGSSAAFLAMSLALLIAAALIARVPKH